MANNPPHWPPPPPPGPPPLYFSEFPADQWIFQKEDDVTVIPLLVVSFMKVPNFSVLVEKLEIDFDREFSALEKYFFNLFVVKGNMLVKNKKIKLFMTNAD